MTCLLIYILHFLLMKMKYLNRLKQIAVVAANQMDGIANYQEYYW